MLDIFIAIFLILTFYGASFVKPISDFNKNYLSVESSNILKGILALFVIIHHLAQRVHGGRIFPFFSLAGYLAVAMFFYLSGYGLMKKHMSHDDYHINFVRRRILPLLIPYILMTILALAINILIGGMKINIIHLLYKCVFTGYTILHFSWFIIAIILFYLVFYVSILLFKKNDTALVLTVFIFYLIYSFTLYSAGYGSWWYNASLAFVIGIVYAKKESSIIKIYDKAYLSVFLLSLAVFATSTLMLFKCKSEFFELILCIISSSIFCILVLCCTLKIRLGNSVLRFLGRISFEMYLCQGIVIDLLKNMPILAANDILYCICVIICTILFAYITDYIFCKVQILLR